ncbi:OTU domain-containing protein At3g57810-like [Durio zibethinus]|uniref:Ubiquitin thioesterase OTU n=1 Tax=Durio zibethinus TaxID=66656 RepID=A0A6P5Z2B0_DURZI|nr:OTU domain-containing protein At3g57810-like [Durio zibethinus]
MIEFVDVNSDADEKIEGADLNLINRFIAYEKSRNSSSSGSAAANNYKITGVLADGRCLFRAIAHGACLKSGEEAPDENRQRELADELRVQVVNELSKRREETEWFIEGDFDAYIKEIQHPYVWGGEPELLMASHVLKTRISVYMSHRTSGNLINIANYGEEYQKDKENPINVLFHGYGHYDILESIPEQNCHQVNA